MQDDNNKNMGQHQELLDQDIGWTWNRQLLFGRVDSFGSQENQGRPRGDF